MKPINSFIYFISGSLELIYIMVCLCVCECEVDFNYSIRICIVCFCRSNQNFGSFSTLQLILFSEESGIVDGSLFLIGGFPAAPNQEGSRWDLPILCPQSKVPVSFSPTLANGVPPSVFAFQRLPSTPPNHENRNTNPPFYVRVIFMEFVLNCSECSSAHIRIKKRRQQAIKLMKSLK